MHTNLRDMDHKACNILSYRHVHTEEFLSTSLGTWPLQPQSHLGTSDSQAPSHARTGVWWAPARDRPDICCDTCACGQIQRNTCDHWDRTGHTPSDICSCHAQDQTSCDSWRSVRKFKTFNYAILWEKSIHLNWICNLGTKNPDFRDIL